MDILFPIASGLGLRLVCINLPEPISRIAPAFIGLWEGTLSHLLILRNPDVAQISTDHFLAYGIRLVLDLVLSRDPLRPVTVALWTGVGIFLCQALDQGQQAKPSRKRSRRRRVSGSASLPSHVRVYEAPPPKSPTKAEGISNHVSPRAHERPSTPPSFFLQGEDFEILNLSSTPNRPPLPIDPPTDPPSVIAPVAETATAEDPQAVPLALPTPPATSISADVDKGTGTSGQRLSTIVEASSGEETTTLTNAIEGEANKALVNVPAKDTASLESKELEYTTSRTPTKADPVPLPVPDPLMRKSRQKAAAASRTSTLVDSISTAGPTANAITTKILLRPYNDEEELASDELQTPLNPVSRALLEEDVNNVLSENESDELQTPLRMGGQLSPLSLPVQVRLTDPLTRVAQSNVRYVESAELEQLTILNPPRRGATQSIDAVIEASNTLPRNSLLMASESALSSPMSEAESSILWAAGPTDLYTHGDDWRQKARQEEKILADLKTQYKAAVMDKRVKDAFILKGQINECSERIGRLHEKAAKRFYKGSRSFLMIYIIYILVNAIIARNTPGKPQTVDVHGLRVQEAIEVVEKAFRDALTSGYGTLKVITGKGLHSKNNLPVLKNAVIREMEK